MPEAQTPPKQNSPQPISSERDSRAPELVYAAGRPPRSASSDHLIQKVVGRAIGVLIVVAAVVLGLIVTRLYYAYPRTDDAYVRANVVGIAAHVSGPIVQMPIADNQHVKQGDLLFVVDPRPYQSVVDRTEADLALTNLQIKALDDAIRFRAIARNPTARGAGIRQAVSGSHRAAADTPLRNCQ
ncbi:MAG TPA: biotin/lipoyl-binding protein [Candidatus Binataceae bacterium]|nr:biotin/lipoyl-binding protein [Candidatus Binataceae bacterium]